MEGIKVNRLKWLIVGYRQFGEMGPEALNVEKLSTILGINRSSFYHHFGDINLYEAELLQHHIERFMDLGGTIDNCNSFQDVMRAVDLYKEEMKFHRQLLINEKTTRYAECFTKAKSFTETKVFKLWAQHDPGGDPASPKEFSLFQTVRDFYLMHFGQLNDNQIEMVINDIQLLMYGKEAADQ